MINSSFLDFLTDLIQKPCTGTLLDKKSSGGRTCNALCICTRPVGIHSAVENNRSVSRDRIKIQINLKNFLFLWRDTLRRRKE